MSRPRANRQIDFFASSSSPFPAGLRYAEDYLSAAEETTLLERFADLPFANALYKSYTAHRRVVSYGARYDFERNVLLPSAPIPEFLSPLAARAAAWAGLAADEVSQALVSEYRAGTQLGWHRDVPEFGVVIGISLGGKARMRFRRYPHRPGARGGFALDLAPRSIYMLAGDARWQWQHAISPTKALRYSITFRTARLRPANGTSASTSAPSTTG